MSNRPVFVPRSKRQSKKRPYFHGAFTGGFSAGYYNTVGSKEGWTPRDQDDNDETVQKPKRPNQRMEDFMDEQDHNEWGGPTSVRKEYDPLKATETRPLSALERIVAEPPPNVGRNLLRVLGWRDGSNAYVPLDNGEDQEPSLLTSKRLRKIRLQQTRVKIPPPKLDVCGLGFSRYRDAPEFERHLEKRKRLAEERARAATGSGGGRNVYRMSHLLDNENDEDDGIESSRRSVEKHHQDHNVSYETIQDFVGSKSVGGFALREDEDDVYDENPVTKKSGDAFKVDNNEYDTVVYEHNSDEEAEEKAQKGNDFGSVLASWASLQCTGPVASSSRGVTSDGRPPLAGFVLGGTNVAEGASKMGTQTIRYAGPDVPFGCEVKRHEFGQDETPEMLGEQSRSMKQDMLLERKHIAAVESLMPKTPNAARPPAVSEKTRSQAPMAGGTFAGLAAAMKNRFTSGGANKSAPMKETLAAHPVGLHQPQAENSRGSVTTNGSAGDAPHEQTTSISITRTIVSFVPESLLCKRFHVSVPKSTISVGSKKDRGVGTGGKGEAAYFHNEILKPAAAERAKQGMSADNSDREKEKETVGNDVNETPLETADRPPMEVFKSIFEPDSASSESDEDPKSEEGKESQVALSQVDKDDNRNGVAEATIAVAENVGIDSLAAPNPVEDSHAEREAGGNSCSRPFETENKDHAEERRREKRQHGDVSSPRSREVRDTAGRDHRKKRRTKTDESSSDDSSDYRRRKRKKERRRHDEKKRRKKHKSSRRKKI